ncbi:MAG: NYN domain-containing protein [Thermomicrobiales bacterium]
MTPKPRANIYVDGFNFYHGCIRGTPYRWLDFGAYFPLVFPHYAINRVRYFTAIVNPTSDDPDKAVRQQTYLRALQTVPGLSIHLGRFSTHVKQRYLASTATSATPTKVDVIEHEEKGSDVNLASYLLVDGFAGEYDVAIVVSNDSDLAEPIRLARSRLGVKIGLLNPRKHTAFDLKGIADFYQRVRRGPLSVSQFPPTLTDANGTITKPPGW